MSTFEQTAQRYIASFNETDPDRRRSLIESLYSADATYTDPNHELEGPVAIEEFVAATQSAFAGYVFSLGGPVDGHHDQARFNWHATAPGDTEPSYIGFDVIATDDGRLRHVYGFMDKTPAS